MPDRAACERRVYRLAVLLTGSPIAATRVIEAVIGAQPDLTRLDGARMDRLTVLRSREIESGTLACSEVSDRARQALASLPFQQREAWVFTTMLAISPREAARAMDCSVSAANRHAALANQAMVKYSSSAVEEWRAYVTTLDVPDFYREKMKRRSRRKRIVGIAIAFVILAAVTAAALWYDHAFTS